MFRIHSFFPFFNHFLSFFMLMFAAGASAMGGGGEGSVLDAVGADDVTEEGSGEGEGEGGEADGAPGEHADGAEGEADTAGEGASAQPAVKTKPGMTPEIAKALETLNATAPKVAKEIKAKLYAGAQAEKALFGLKKDFPGGVADVLALKTAIDTQLGGVDALGQLGQDLKSWTAIDRKWDKKDPSLASDLAAEYPEQFAGMVPHFLNKYAEVAPAAYTKMYAGMVVSEVKGQNIPQALHMLTEYLGTATELGPEQGKPFVAKAAAIVANINEWLSELNKIATTPVPAKSEKQGNDEETRRTSALDLREKQQFNREVSGDYNRFRDDLLGQQLDKILTGNKKALSPERRAVVLEQASKKLSAAMNGVSKFRETVLEYEKAKDGPGLLRYLKSRCGEALKGVNGKPGIVDKAYDALYGDGKLGTKKKAEDPKDKGAPAAGWVKLAKPPATNEISRRLTTAEGAKAGLTYEDMIMKNKYVLNDGRKVYHD